MILHVLHIHLSHFGFLLFAAEIEKQLKASETKLVICTPDKYATVKQAVINMQSDMKIACIKLNLDDVIPDGAIDFEQIADINSE